MPYQVKNYSEIAVHQALKDYLNDNKISCYCDRCQADIIALTLNSLPPRYYVSIYDGLKMKWESDQAHVMAVLISAIQQVSEKNSHS